MSEDGYKFKINEHLLNQTKIMSDIIEDANDPDCFGVIKIFFLCQVRYVALTKQEGQKVSWDDVPNIFFFSAFKFKKRYLGIFEHPNPTND